MAKLCPGQQSGKLAERRLIGSNKLKWSFSVNAENIVEEVTAVQTNVRREVRPSVNCRYPAGDVETNHHQQAA